MKTHIPTIKRGNAFTLIELLVVIAIIGILAGMIVPAVVTALGKAKTAKAKVEVSGIVGAINSYNADYSRLPATVNTRQAHAGKNYQNTTWNNGSPDWTFGNFNTPGLRQNNVPPQNNYTLVRDTPFAGRNPNNSEVTAILMDLLNINDFSGGVVNENHSQNPKKNVYLNAKVVGNYQPGGVDSFGVYRDPWGHPYIIILDLDYDNRVLSPFPLLRGTVTEPRFIPGNALVMSLGPDGKADFTVDQDNPVNKDNIYSWK